MAFLSKLLGGGGEEKTLNSWQKFVDKINSLEPSFEQLDQNALRAKTLELKERLTQGETLDDMLPEAFAAGP